jgi:hypothetical protein
LERFAQMVGDESSHAPRSKARTIETAGNGVMRPPSRLALRATLHGPAPTWRIARVACRFCAGASCDLRAAAIACPVGLDGAVRLEGARALLGGAIRLPAGLDHETTRGRMDSRNRSKGHRAVQKTNQRTAWDQGRRETPLARCGHCPRQNGCVAQAVRPPSFSA